jgi:hypothetical protein
MRRHRQRRKGKRSSRAADETSVRTREPVDDGSCDEANSDLIDSREACEVVAADLGARSWREMDNAEDTMIGRFKTEAADSDDDEALSESTDNYYTDLDPANSDIVDNASSYSQTTVAYWNQDVQDDCVTCDNDTVDVSSAGDVDKNVTQQNSDEVTVTKTLASVYSGQLSATVDCKLICDNAMCIVPAAPPLDDAVDLHPLSRVLQVGSPAVERPPLEMTFVR